MGRLRDFTPESGHSWVMGTFMLLVHIAAYAASSHSSCWRKRMGKEHCSGLAVRLNWFLSICTVGLPHDDRQFPRPPVWIVREPLLPHRQ